MKKIRNYQDSRYQYDDSNFFEENELYVFQNRQFSAQCEQFLLKI